MAHRKTGNDRSAQERYMKSIAGLRAVSGAKLLLLATSAIPTVALAQTAAPIVEEPAAVQDDTDSGEIVVIAQRREERLRDVPISISVVSAAELTGSGATTSRDLSTMVPGLTIASNGVYIQPTVRGIGSNLNSVGSEAAVALYIDGVYSPNTASNIFDLANVQQIEVLKGPQGTLFGRNATGGAILVTTRNPSQNPMLRASIGYGSFKEMRASAYVAGPITDSLSADFSVLRRVDDGYARDALSNDRLSSYDETSVRGKVVFQPSSAFSIILAGDYAKVSDLAGVSNKVWNGNTSTVGAIVPADPREYALSFKPINDVEAFGGSATLQYDFGGVRLRSLSALRQVNQHSLTDTDRTQVATGRSDLFANQDSFSQEVTLASNGNGPLSWIIGAYYFRDKGKTPKFILNNAPFITSVIDTRAISGFSEVSYAFSERLSVTAGIRYSDETKDFDAWRTTGQVADQKAKWGAWTPRVSVRFSPTDSTSVYATYSEGFKSGAFLATVVPQTPVNPEYVRAYETGFKFAQGRNYLNLAAYYYDYDNLQVTAYQPGAAILRNAATARIWGLEAEGAFAVSDAFNVRAGFAYTNARYTDFTTAVVLVPRPTGGNLQLNGDASGNHLIRSPEVTANVSANYTIPVGSGSVTLNGTAAYNSGFFWNASNRLKQPEYVIANASIAWKVANTPMTVTLWARNLTDKLYGIFAVDTTAADAIAYGRPRSIGATLSFDF
ncbi:MAG: TonB-dependent receptor [Sphingomonadales bacterium]|nr:MAG: TonB-dependent receptor [Sphingomonadales bacterium]